MRLPRRVVATPHAWGYEAFAGVRHCDGTLARVSPQVATLAVMAAGLLTPGEWSLRRPITRPR